VHLVDLYGVVILQFMVHKTSHVLITLFQHITVKENKLHDIFAFGRSESCFPLRKSLFSGNSSTHTGRDSYLLAIYYVRTSTIIKTPCFEWSDATNFRRHCLRLTRSSWLKLDAVHNTLIQFACVVACLMIKALDSRCVRCPLQTNDTVSVTKQQ
jgi:hypothetical protein